MDSRLFITMVRTAKSASESGWTQRFASCSSATAGPSLGPKMQLPAASFTRVGGATAPVRPDLDPTLGEAVEDGC